MPEQSSSGLRQLAVHAHPDDESSNGAAVAAKYTKEGAEVMVVTCTGGELGDIINPALQGNEKLLANLTQVRREEMANAAKILGIKHHWLGYPDSGFPDGLMEGKAEVNLPEGCFAAHDVAVPAAKLAAVIRDFKPHVVTTYNEIGGYPHPDHLMAHQVAKAAFLMAGDADADVPGEPWQPAKLYYFASFTTERLEALHKAMEAAGQESPYTEWLARREQNPVFNREALPNRANIECSEFFSYRDDALRAHATQVDPNGHFFAVPRDIEKDAWPVEQYELAASTLPVVAGETDLFAGVRGTDVVTTGGDPAALQTWWKD